MINYIGLDGHSTTCTFVVLNEKGKMINQEQVTTSEANLIRFVRSQNKIRKLVYEESNLSKWFYTVLKNEVDELVVCNPLYLGKKQKSKNDFNDALHLANELRCDHIVPVFQDDGVLMDMRAMVSAYRDIATDLTRAKNRYKALFRSEALFTKGATIYSSPERIKELSGKLDRFIAKNIFEQIKHFENIKNKYLKVFEVNCKKYPMLKNLDSVPGIDIVRANIIGALICSPYRFKNKHKLWAYAMLVRHNQESDGVSYGKKTVYGRLELKNAFIGIAESALLHNNSLKKYYDQLRSKSVDHYAARKSVARKAAAICLAVMKKGKPYKDYYKEETLKKDK